jgi:tetratricopeptide (TPR) repeat protein
MNAEDSKVFLVNAEEALSNNKGQLALRYFERAIQRERTPDTCSYLGYCLATQRKSFNGAISLLREAIDREPDNPLHYLIYGRILAMSGDEEEAVVILRQGLEYGMHFDFIKELELLGMKKSSVFKRLARRHILNRYFGFILSRIKIW